MCELFLQGVYWSSRQSRLRVLSTHKSPYIILIWFTWRDNEHKPRGLTVRAAGLGQVSYFTERKSPQFYIMSVWVLWVTPSTYNSFDYIFIVMGNIVWLVITSTCLRIHGWINLLGAHGPEKKMLSYNVCTTKWKFVVPSCYTNIYTVTYLHT